MRERQGDHDGAAALYSRVGNRAALQGLQQSQADLLQGQARAATSPEEKARLYRQAIALDAADPWLRLEFARTLLAAQQPDEAREVMAPVTDASRLSPDAARAGIYYAQAAGDDALAVSLAARLPAQARTPDIGTAVAQSAAALELQSVRAEPTLGAMRARMLERVGKPDPDGARGVAFAQELIRRGDKPGARAVLAAGLAHGGVPPQQRLAYAGMLMAAGYPQDAQAVTAVPGSSLPVAQQASLRSVQAAAAAQRADQLNGEGNPADAYDQLAPQLARDPDSPTLNMALARLYQAQQRPRAALQIDEDLLQSHPDDLSVHVAAVSAALGAGDRGRAAAIARQATQRFPGEPGAWLAAAQVARAQHDDGEALADLRTARSLRQQQLAGPHASGAAGVSGGLEGRVRRAQYALYQPRTQATDADPVTRVYEQDAPAATNATAAEDDPVINSILQPSPVLAPASRPVRSAQEGGPIPVGNPFRPSGQATPDEPAGLPGLGRPARTRADPVLAEIDRTAEQINTEMAPQVNASVALRGRSGPTGLASLYDLSAPVEATYSPGGYGRLKVTATPEYLNTGNTSSNNRQFFGTNPLAATGASLQRGDPNAAGVAVGLGYSVGIASADVGTTPLGFRLASVVGGLELAPQLAPDLTLRATAERRAVADSLLSYGGERDTLTGRSWGGVTRDHAHLQLEGAVHDVSYYVGAGGGVLTGQNVRSNTEVDAGAGFSLPVWRRGDSEVRAGLDLVYFAYSRNLQNFTFGSGGYFSPQTFVAGLFPVTFRQTVSPDLVWSIGGSLGVQTFNERSTPVFQDSTLQGALLATAAVRPGTITTLWG